MSFATGRRAIKMTHAFGPTALIFLSLRRIKPLPDFIKWKPKTIQLK